MDADQAAAPGEGGILARLRRFQAGVDAWALTLTPLALFLLRLPVAWVFWRSGRTKVEGWNIFDITDAQPFLFEHEFGMPFPVLTAHVTAVAEHVLAALLVVGLLTRFSALGLLVMTIVIQVFIFPDAWFTTHMWWAVTLVAVMILGPGKISLDYLLGRAFGGAK